MCAVLKNENKIIVVSDKWSDDGKMNRFVCNKTINAWCRNYQQLQANTGC